MLLLIQQTKCMQKYIGAHTLVTLLLNLLNVIIIFLRVLHAELFTTASTGPSSLNDTPAPGYFEICQAKKTISQVKGYRSNKLSILGHCERDALYVVPTIHC